MLQINVPGRELYDSKSNRFIDVKDTTLQLEHSLLSISKWEENWCKPFLVKTEKTPEETIDYIKCMTNNKNADPNIYLCLTQENIDQISEYIARPMTATTVSNSSSSNKRGPTMTAELLYSRMFAYQIPLECERWHINKLIMLLRVKDAENSTQDKKTQKNPKQLAMDYATLNAQRKQNKKGKVK